MKIIDKAVPTIYEVSRLAGVSLATVSRVINDSDRVREKTRQKVLAAMEELGYRPNSMAQALASNRSNSVGVLVSELHGPFFGAMLSTIEKTLRAAGKFAIFTAGHSEEANEKEGMQFLMSRNCDAMILHVEATTDQYLLECKDSMIPFVLVNRLVPGLGDRCIALNNERGSYLATKMILQLGHRQVAYVSGPLNWADARERLAGHKRALAEFGLHLEPSLFREGDYREDSGSRALAELLDQEVQFSAAVCANDEMAAGAMAVAHDRGLAVPEDLSIVGFDNAPLSRYLYPKLSTVDYPIEDMSRMAARWLLRNVYGDETLEIVHQFEPKLLPRESSRPVKD
jgi:LacI family transcriptional regulator